MKMVFLSNAFYTKYEAVTELMLKRNRPYACLSVRIDDIQFAIPIRHHITHKYCFITMKEFGLDYTKSVIIDSPGDISQEECRIDTKEWNLLKANESKIIYDFKKYLHQYKRALANPTNPRSQKMLRYSTLQYFMNI